MTDEKKEYTRDRVAPGAGGTSTPIAGSKDGLGEQDPVMIEEVGRTDERETDER